MRTLKQTLLAALVLGIFVLGTAGIVMSEEEQPAGGASGGTMSNMSTTAPAPLAPASISPAS